MRTRLVYKNLFEIVDGEGTAIVSLTDEAGRRALNVTIDKLTKYQLAMRNLDFEQRKDCLPEVLCWLFGRTLNADRFEIMVVDLVAGEYKAVLLDTDTYYEYHLRMGDAVLLARISNIPIYMRTDLFMRQSVKYDEKSNRTALPINILPTQKIRYELDRAVQEEDYRRASLLRDVLNERLKEEGKAPENTDE